MQWQSLPLPPLWFVHSGGLTATCGPAGKMAKLQLARRVRSAAALKLFFGSHPCLAFLPWARRAQERAAAGRDRRRGGHEASGLLRPPAIKGGTRRVRPPQPGQCGGCAHEGHAAAAGRALCVALCALRLSRPEGPWGVAPTPLLLARAWPPLVGWSERSAGDVTPRQGLVLFSSKSANPGQTTGVTAGGSGAAALVEWYALMWA